MGGAAGEGGGKRGVLPPVLKIHALVLGVLSVLCGRWRLGADNGDVSRIKVKARVRAMRVGPPRCLREEEQIARDR